MRYSEEVKKFISDNVRGTPVRVLAEMVSAEFGIDFTESKMRAFMKNHKLKNGRPTGVPTGAPTAKYPARIRDFIQANYKGVGPKEMAELLNETFGTAYTHMQMKGYYGRSKLDSGVAGWFKPGFTPWNKGMKGVSYPGSIPTQFKKGTRSANWVPIGSERVNADGYVDIKVDDGKLQKNWKGKHILIWEEHNGPVPPGHVIIFGDGNNRNFDPGNLLCVSRAQLVRLNQRGLIQNDAELTKAGIIIADISNKIGERKKKNRGARQ